MFTKPGFVIIHNYLPNTFLIHTKTIHGSGQSIIRLPLSTVTPSISHSEYPKLTDFIDITLDKVHPKKPDAEDLGWFPNLFEDPWVYKPKTLFVNAWDPHSVPGNGNEADESLDGRIGRITNIAVNGTPMTNPHMKYIAVKV